MIRKHTRSTKRHYHPENPVNPVNWRKARRVGVELAILAEELAEFNPADFPAVEIISGTNIAFRDTGFEMDRKTQIALVCASKDAYRTEQSVMVLPPIGTNIYPNPIQLHISFFKKNARQAFFEMIFIFEELGHISMSRIGGQGELAVSIRWRSGTTPYPQILKGFIKPVK